MSRVVFVAADVEDVTAACAKLAIGISTIEPLDSGGTRVVLNNSEDAARLGASLKARLIEGPVVRSPLHAWRTTAPFS